VKEQICAVAVLASVMAGVALAQSGREEPAREATQAPGGVVPQIERCLHGGGETTAEKARRDEAIAAMRMIDYVLIGSPRVPRPMQWRDLARDQRIDVLRGQPNAVGDLARKILWGFDEPLPGWRIAWAWTWPRAVYSLTDQRDPCALTLSSQDPEVIPGAGGELRIVPLDTY
jgi:hypothetical protein